MNKLKIILLIILTINIIYPCGDIHNISNQDISSESYNTEDDCEPETESDLCSPLCVCECCAITPVVEFDKTYNFSLAEIPNILFTKSCKPISVISIIFQPPKYHI